MVMGSDQITRPEREHLPRLDDDPGTVLDHDDRVVAVRHRTSTIRSHGLCADHRGLLRALVGHLMPADDVAMPEPEIAVRYIDWLIANEGNGVDVPLMLADVYGSGCELVQEHARRAYGRRVQDMTSTEHDQLVWDMLEGSMDGFERFSPTWFFHTLRRHIAEAMQGQLVTPN